MERSLTCFMSSIRKPNSNFFLQSNHFLCGNSLNGVCRETEIVRHREWCSPGLNKTIISRSLPTTSPSLPLPPPRLPTPHPSILVLLEYWLSPWASLTGDTQQIFRLRDISDKTDVQLDYKISAAFALYELKSFLARIISLLNMFDIPLQICAEVASLFVSL